MKYLSALVLMLSLFAAACSGNAVPTVTVAPVSPTPVVESTPVPAAGTTQTTFNADNAYEYNRKLSVDIGKRVAGTDGGQAAADFIAGEFKKSGLDVTQQAFPFEGWEDKGTTVQMTAPQTAPLEAQAIQYSPGGKVSGDVVLVPGLGTRDDFSKVNVRGKIALVKRGTVPFGTKALNGQEVGATAVLIYNDAAPVFTGTMREQISIPAIALSGAAGTTLLDALKDGTVRVQIDSDAGVIQRTGHNVIGTIKGKSDETIVLGGHFDSVPAGPGAGDNGSGTATILELARVLGAKPQPEHTLVFIAFDAEELGLLGSRAYVDGLTEDQIQHMTAMLNFDMLGAGGGPLLLMGNGNVALLGRSSAQQLGIEAHNGTLPANAGSDHESFARRGVDTVFFMRDYNLLHTPQDTIDQIHKEYLDEAGRVAERLIERLDAAPLKAESSWLLPTE